MQSKPSVISSLLYLDCIILFRVLLLPLFSLASQHLIQSGLRLENLVLEALSARALLVS